MPGDGTVASAGSSRSYRFTYAGSLGHITGPVESGEDTAGAGFRSYPTTLQIPEESGRMSRRR